MSRGRHRFTQTEIRRAITAVGKEQSIKAVEILPDGGIRVVVGGAPAGESKDPPPGHKITL